MPPRIAIAQIAMHWTAADNTAAVERARVLASERQALVCAFSELAVTGFHRHIGQEARREIVEPALQRIRALAARLGLGVAVGAPTFGPGGAVFNTHLLIDETGQIVAEIAKRGLTDPEATFFARGTSRPVGALQGLRCSAVICREVEDLVRVSWDLPGGAADLIFVPGALRQDPDQPRTDPPAHVHDIQRLAATTRAYVVQTNWPNALNRPEESVDGGGSVVVSPQGEVLLRLPMQASGVGVFALGEPSFEWHPM